MTRTKARPRFTLTIWKTTPAGYSTTPEELDAAILAGGHDERTLRRRLGVGYRYLEELRAGKLLDGWAASHVDAGIAADRPHGADFADLSVRGPRG